MAQKKLEPKQDSKKQPSGCGCANIPLSLIIVIMGCCYWLFTQRDNLKISQFVSNIVSNFLAENPQLNIGNIPILQPQVTPTLQPTPSVISVNSQNANSQTTNTATTKIKPSVIPPSSQPSLSTRPDITANQENTINKTPQKKSKLTAKVPANTWDKKGIKAIYLSRYQVTNNASEATIRQRVRYFRSQGFNTIIHGVWGNGCTMYNSKVMQQTLGFKSCPNNFEDQWLDWLIDEAHKQKIEVHAYFEKGIKIDKDSPIFDLAIARKWIVPGIDKTYPGIEHYVLDVEIPEVANLFKNTLVEFVQRYPKIDAVQWDDYLGYHADLPGKVDRTTKLTAFVQQMIGGMKKANPNVSFDICHHNPYWAKRYFAADWEKWNVDRVFIQVYNDANFQEELNYVKNYDGIAFSEQQFSRLNDVVKNPDVKSILVFPLSGKPEETASKLNSLLTNSK
ncbi:family 10 glycosylhydrolase [Anabaena sp. FACHB-1237]|uniref:family 10 glycosylhydrolase n=1 Tax=Anabaena sp. FACHB-1237 TaxID=2692769 RepID=UPI001680583D|nr:family 10 glycosylhydrolase [Anabaena sp. FACHB-1237]MBD2136730.1 family 10 glycosylhydrolase [Anabaena sp. FACHB-1237]